MRLARAFAAASWVWMFLLTLAAWCPGGIDMVCQIVFGISSHLCHQQPDRSFHWGVSAWPVCARCLGLYGAAPAGALLALGVPFASASAPSRNLVLLCAAAIPTACTWLLEHVAGVSLSNAVRFVAAWPLGAAVAWLAVRTLLNSQYTLQDARRGQAR